MFIDLARPMHLNYGFTLVILLISSMLVLSAILINVALIKTKTMKMAMVPKAKALLSVMVATSFVYRQYRCYLEKDSPNI